MEREWRLFIGGSWIESPEKREVRSPYNGEVVGICHRAAGDHVESAIVASVKAFSAFRDFSSYRRSLILENILGGVKRRTEELARTISLEAGKPIKASRIEVERSLHTFSLGVQESTRIGGDLIPLDVREYSENRVGILKRVPVGPITAITPFNFPLNLVAHKVSPCLSAGNTMVLKPASQTPVTALILAEICSEAGIPEGGLNVVPCSPRIAEPLITDERMKMVTFTGSSAVGWKLKTKAGRKKITLELGGNAGVIVHTDADLNFAAERCVSGGFSYAGQSCISVQRIFVQQKIYDDFMHIFLEKVKALRVGDPLDEHTDVGPMITLQDARRAESWIKEAVEMGAVLLMGGERDGSLLNPAVLTGTRPEMKVNHLEIFAPVVTVEKYSEFSHAVKMVDNSEYGLQAGIFTRDIELVEYAFRNLEVGGLMVGDVPTFRVDHMPYGGAKLSGFGREGIKYAIEHMTEPRLLVLNFQPGRGNPLSKS
ncbi:MAG: aldehyde dehydrogenase family protein [Fidelibacterota bacterium]